MRFGRTLFRAQFRHWAESGFDALVLPNNTRGLMSVNFTAGTRIDGGLEMEREVMSHAPLTLGTAIATGSGNLRQFGVEQVIHAIVSESLGDPPRELQLRQATMAAMKAIEVTKCRNVGMLPLGSGHRAERISRTQSIPMMLEEIIGHLRRVSSRVESVSLLCNSETEREEVDELLQRVRKDWWGLRG